MSEPGNEALQPKKQRNRNLAKRAILEMENAPPRQPLDVLPAVRPMKHVMIARAWEQAMAKILAKTSQNEALTEEEESEASAALTERFARYRGGHELAFVLEQLHLKRMWAAQQAALHSAHNNQRTAWRAHRKAGKTKTLACIAESFLNIYPSIVVTMAPSQRQVNDLLWGEIRTLHHSGLLGRADTTQIRIGPRHYAIGFSTNTQDRVQGFHADVEPPEDEALDFDADAYLEWLLERRAKAVEQGRAMRDHKLVFLLDECPGIQQRLIEAIKGSLAGDHVHLFLAGNPTIDANEEHEFARAFRDGSGYHRIHTSAVPAHDPVGADERFDRAPVWMVPPGWVEERKEDWGESSPMFLAYVLGQFAGVDSTRKIITLEMLEAALLRGTPGVSMGRHIGVDVAASEDGKGDSSVASLWIDGVKCAEHVWHVRDTMQSAEIVQALRARWGEDIGGPLPDGAPPVAAVPGITERARIPVPASNVHIDDLNVGRGVVDRLRQMGVDVDAVDFGAAPRYDWKHLTGEMLFKNRRAELHWVFRRALQEGMAMLPKKYKRSWQEHQWAELLDPKETAGGTMLQVVPKKDLKAKYGRSPDHSDSDLLAFSRGSARMRISVL